jgi:hypothetical protein
MFMLVPVIGALASLSANGQTMESQKVSIDATTKFSGDFRYRHERIDDDSKSVSRIRDRLRLRLRADAKVSDEVSVVARLATGDQSASSTNENLDGGFSTKGAWLDLAYIQYKPADLNLTALAGKTVNPFIRVGESQLIWDNDVNPEGVSVGYALGGEGLNLAATAAYYSVNELSDTADDVSLQAGQLALGYKTELFKVTVGTSVYAYQNIKDTPSVEANPRFLGNLSLQAGETKVYANDYELQNAFAEVSLTSIPVAVFYDTVLNKKVGENNRGWLAGLSVGSGKGSIPVKLAYNYRVLEKEAVLGNFSDSDFVGGGTDGRGHTVALEYGVTDTIKIAYTQSITEKSPDSETTTDYNRGMADISVKF